MPCLDIEYVEESSPYAGLAWEGESLCLGAVLVPKKKELTRHDFYGWYSSQEERANIGLILIKSEDKPSPKERFTELVKQWKEETWFLSSLRRRVSHIAHLKIIGFGAVAIPWILEELQREPDYWFPALEAIAEGDDPAPHAENMNELREAWLEWGRANGYIT